MQFTKYSFALLAFSLSVPATAADIAVYQRDLYDRMTFENSPSGDVVSDGNIVSIPISAELSVIEKNNILEKSRSLSSLNVENKRLVLSFNEAVSDTRHFRIGNKIILDLFLDMESLATLPKQPDNTENIQNKELRPTEAISKAASQAIELGNNLKNSEIKATIANPQIKTVDTATDKDPSIDKTAAPVQVVSDEAPELPLAKTLPELAEASVITISSTTPFGLTVFERFGRLFVVTDQANMAVPPQVSGNAANLGWVMTEIPMEGGRAWMMPVPEGAFLRPEGRGLIWRVIISDTDPQLETADIRRRMTEADNPKIDILMSNTATLLKLTDPDYKDDLAIITVNRSTSRMQKEYDFMGFDILPAVIGAVIKPEADGLRLQASSEFVAISNINGLVIAKDSQNEVIKSYLNNEGRTLIENRKTRTTLDRVFYFSDWGGSSKPQNYIKKRKDLDNFLALAQKENKLGIILDLVKLTLSQGMGHEALGYLNMAKDVNSQIEQASEYQALRGAAHFLAHQYNIAKNYFESDSLTNIAETNLWLAASEAALGNEKTALDIYNDTALLTAIYPYEIKQEVIAPLALAFLNQKQGEQALPLIDLIDQGHSKMSQEQKATLAYLKGRTQSVTGRPDEGISNLYKASTGDKLGPYGIRSELLLIEDELARDVIQFDEAIKRMERLRFAWRGDALESEIQQKLGELYIRNEQPRKGLSILKRAATTTDYTTVRRDIIRLMADAYKSIFIGEEYNNLDPLIAVAVYDEFKELTPVGDEGNRLIDSLADKLMSINLNSRAANVLKDKMDRLGGGQNAIKSGLRIASIELLDREPENALKTLQRVDQMMGPYRGEDKDELNNRIVLYKARALSESGEPQKALFMTEGLDDTDDVIKLRIDTAWRSGQWVAVTDNLSKLLARQNITSSEPPSQEQAQLILNQAVALSLSDQYDSLQRFARLYDDVMKQTALYKQFLVVSRPQNISNLADRATLLDVTSEVDLFQGVLKREEDKLPAVGSKETNLQ